MWYLAPVNTSGPLQTSLCIETLGETKTFPSRKSRFSQFSHSWFCFGTSKDLQTSVFIGTFIRSPSSDVEEHSVFSKWAKCIANKQIFCYLRLFQMFAILQPQNCKKLTPNPGWREYATIFWLTLHTQLQLAPVNAKGHRLNIPTEPHHLPKMKKGLWGSQTRSLASTQLTTTTNRIMNGERVWWSSLINWVWSREDNLDKIFFVLWPYLEHVPFFRFYWL